MGPVAGETWGLGRTLTAYSDAALHADDADAALEAAEGLNDVGGRLMATPEDDPDVQEFRAEGLTYKATGACGVTSVLSRAGDRPSLERALAVVDDTLGLLRKAPRALVERTNIAHTEALAALQLGDVGRVHEAVERGVATATRIKDDYQLKFFGWARRVAALIAAPAGRHPIAAGTAVRALAGRQRSRGGAPGRVLGVAARDGGRHHQHPDDRTLKSCRAPPRRAQRVGHGARGRGRAHKR